MTYLHRPESLGNLDKIDSFEVLATAKLARGQGVLFFAYYPSLKANLAAPLLKLRPLVVAIHLVEGVERGCRQHLLSPLNSSYARSVPASVWGAILGMGSGRAGRMAERSLACVGPSGLWSD